MDRAFPRWTTTQSRPVAYRRARRHALVGKLGTGGKLVRLRTSGGNNTLGAR